MQKNKIGYSWLKNIKANVGNKGLYASADGKVNLFKTGFDYTVSYKLKPLQQNFYEDSSLGFSVKWNIWVFLHSPYTLKYLLLSIAISIITTYFVE